MRDAVAPCLRELDRITPADDGVPGVERKRDEVRIGRV
jgi:hypothetical protein